MNSWPQSLRPVAKYVARGNEVEASNPVVAFYCNLHAVKEAIRLNKGDGDAFIHSLMEKTEALKKRIGPQDEGHQQLVEAHALELFAIADDDDMTGNVTPATAKKYFVALCFLDVCKVFPNRSDEVEKKSNFTKSRMIAINRALRDGTDPRRPELIRTEQEEAELKELYPESGGYPENSASAPPPPPPSAPSEPSAPPSFPIDEPTNARPLYPTNDDRSDVTGGMGRLGLQDSPSYPRQAPIYESFVDPVKNDTFTNGPPPMRPPPSVPSSANSSFSTCAVPHAPSPAPSAPYIPSPTPSSSAHAPPYVSSSQTIRDDDDSDDELTVSNGDSKYNPSIQEVKSAQQNAKHAVSALDFSDYSGAISFLEEALATLKKSAR